MRIVHLLHQARVGSELLVPRLLSALDRRQFEPVVVLATDGPLRPRIEALDVPVHILPLRWWIPSTHQTPRAFLAQLEGLEQRVEELTAWLAGAGADIVHTQFIVTLEGALAAARLGLPHVWHSRGFFGDGFPPPWFDDTRFLYSVVDRLSDRVLCMSEGIARQMAAGVRPELLQVTYDGLDFDDLEGRPATDQAAVRAELGIAPAAPVVATAGGIQRRKGQIDLVEAAPALVAAFPDLVIVLAGVASDAEYRQRLVDRIAELGLTAHFRLPGFISDIRALISTAQVFAHPSHTEGFGLGILEAMALGRPVVATRSGGPEEMVEDGVSGLLVPVRDPSALAAAVEGLLRDPARARTLGAAAAARARTFGLERTALDLAAVYRTLAAQAPPRDELARDRRPVAATITAEVLERARRAGAAGATGPGAAGSSPAPQRSPRGPRGLRWRPRARG